MEATITISIFPKETHPDGFEIDGTPEILTFDSENLLNVLRQISSIPTDQQRHWQFESIEFK